MGDKGGIKCAADSVVGRNLCERFDGGGSAGAWGDAGKIYRAMAATLQTPQR